MSDELNHRTRPWHDVLAALPDERPPGDGWTRLSRVLDAEAPRESSRRRGSWAIAAALAVLTPVLALRMLDRDAGADVAGLASRGTSDASPVPRLARRTAVEPMAVSKPMEAADALDAARAAGRARVPDGVRGPTGTSIRDAAGPHAVASAGPRRPGSSSAVSTDTIATRNGATSASDAASIGGVARTGVADSPRAPAVPTPDVPTDTTSRLLEHHVVADAEVARSTRAASPQIEPHAQPPTDPLQPLYAESAQLEALLALTRDGRVASATGAALSDALSERLAALDAALAQPGLPDAQRAALWRDRIATLRQLAGVESTERWLAVHGRAYGDAFVRVD